MECLKYTLKGLSRKYKINMWLKMLNLEMSEEGIYVDRILVESNDILTMMNSLDLIAIFGDMYKMDRVDAMGNVPILNYNRDFI